MDITTVSASNGPECSLVSDDMEGICVMPDLTTIKTEVTNPDEASTQNVAMGIKFILPNRFDMNVCSRFVKSLNEEDSKNIQDQVNSDLEVASVLFKGKEPRRPLCLFLFSVNEPSLCALMFGVQMLLFFFLQPSVTSRLHRLQEYKCAMFTHRPPPNISPPSNSLQH